jgi:hypothetical protein
MNATIPVYRADGRLYDHVTERGLARLQEAGLIARVVRHRKGHINRAILFVRPGEAPMPRTAYMGTPDDVRPIFLQVVTDCLVRA